MTEGDLHHAAEEPFVASQFGDVVARKPYHGTLHLWRRVEHRWLYGEEVLHVVPCLHQHRQYAILLVTRLGGHAKSHLVLYHARAAGDEVAIVEHLEEYLRRDVVGVVACKHELPPSEHLVEVHAEEVALDDIKS